MTKKYKMTFSESNLQESVAYILVSKFNIEPNIIRAGVEDTGGVLILSMKGTDQNISDAIAYLKEQNITVDELGKHISRDKNKCFSCGSCISICPTKSFTIDPETYEVHLNIETCVACGSCLTACPTHAVKLSV